MEVWYDPGTMEIKAIYSNRYSGTWWQGQGFEVFQSSEVGLRSDMEVGATISISSSEAGSSSEVRRPADVIVLVRAPAPLPDPNRVRLDQLHTKLRSRDLSSSETQELLRLERGL